jgi:hypothetical protein
VVAVARVRAGNVAAAMRLLISRGRRRVALPALALGCCATLLASCGGAQQDAHEPQASFALEVVNATFATEQAVARPASLQLTVRNAGRATVPEVAVQVQSFNQRSEYPGLADRRRPVWIVDEGPGAVPKQPVETVPFDSPAGDVTANANVWAAGPLAAGATRTFSWRLEPVAAGRHAVAYAVSAGLNGRARAVTAGGGPVTGHFQVTVADAPPPTHVNPETGAVQAGAAAVAPGP